MINSHLEKDIRLDVYDKEKCILFGLGRNAMYAACQATKLKPGDTVLTPAFDCDATLTPFRVLGLNVRFFKSDPYTFQVDIDDIKKKITSDVKLLHIINHFGFSQPWHDLTKLAENAGLVILEDNASSLFSEIDGRALGTFGDFSIFSLYKVLPMIDGGMLRVNNSDYQVKLSPRKRKWFYATERKKVLNTLISKFGLNRLASTIKNKVSSPKNPLPPLYSDKPGYPDWKHRDEILPEFSCDYLRPISKFAYIQLLQFSKQDPNLLKDDIRYYYNWLVEQLRDIKGITILHPEIPAGIVPACLSILIESHRDDFYIHLKRMKFSVMAWPTFSGDVIDEREHFTEIEIIGRRILQIHIPVFRFLSERYDDYYNRLAMEIRNLSKTYL